MVMSWLFHKFERRNATRGLPCLQLPAAFSDWLVASMTKKP
jgi:hypothetical protein